MKVSPGPADYKMRSSFDHSETASQTGFTQGGELAKNLGGVMFGSFDGVEFDGDHLWAIQTGHVK